MSQSFTTADTDEVIQERAQQRNLQRIDVVVKIAERCNLACTYCYFFSDEGHGYKIHPSRMSSETWSSVVMFLRDGVKECGAGLLRVVFHGGEPTLVGAANFDRMCKEIRDHLDGVVSLDLAIQTNGTLVSPAWVRVLKKHAVAVGVSMDGPAEYNDIARVDHKGNGSHSATVKGVALLMDAAKKAGGPKPGALFVVNPEYDPQRIYDHLVKELGFDAIDALLPDQPSVDDAASYGHFLAGLFDAWVTGGDPSIYIRTFRAFLDRLAGFGSYQFPMDPSSDDFMSLSISSDGSLKPDDIVLDTRWSDAHCATTSLRQFSLHPLYQDWMDAAAAVPAECSDCCWVNICRGGHPWHRYQTGNGYHGRSRYCEGLKVLYSHVSAFMLKSGYPLPLLLNQLGLGSETFDGSTLHAKH